MLHPFIELTVLTVSKPVGDLTEFEQELVRRILLEMSNVR